MLRYNSVTGEHCGKGGASLPAWRHQEPELLDPRSGYAFLRRLDGHLPEPDLARRRLTLLSELLDERSRSSVEKGD